MFQKIPYILIDADEIRAFLKNDQTVFKYKLGNRWIVNYDQLEPHLKRISKTECPYWSEFYRRINAKKVQKKEN